MGTRKSTTGDGFVSPLRHQHMTTDVTPLFWRLRTLLRRGFGLGALFCAVSIMLMLFGSSHQSVNSTPLLVVFGAFMFGALAVASLFFGMACLFIRCACRCSLCGNPVQIQWAQGVVPYADRCLHCGATIMQPPTFDTNQQAL